MASCEANPTFSWLIATDQTVAEHLPKNVRILSQSKAEFERRVSTILDVQYQFSYGYKLCDLKPVYGHIYQAELESFDFWGYCDLDVIFGRLDEFITDDLLNCNDVITSLELIVAGHCTLLRNTEYYRTMYRQCEEFGAKLCSPHYEVFDELTFSSFVKRLSKEKKLRLAVIEMHAEDSILKWNGRRSFCFHWSKQGLIDCVENRSIGYFHFIQSKSKSNFHIPPPHQELRIFFVTNSGFFPMATWVDLTLFHFARTYSMLRCIPWYTKQALKYFLPDRARKAISSYLPKRKQD